MTDHHFETHGLVRLYTEIGKGSVQVVATDTTETRVEVVGRDAEHVQVRQDGDQITVVGPKQRGIFGDHRLDVVVRLPSDSTITVRTGSAGIAVRGTVGGGQLKSGSGDVVVEVAAGALSAETGSGDIRVDEARAELKAKSGSGDVVVAEAAAGVLVSTGSGDVQVSRAHGAVVVKTGSGDVKVGDAGSDVSVTTGSGDLVVGTARRGRVTAKGASGDVHVGIPAGTPVWTDISTVAGEIRSSLNGAGQPQEGADYVEVRAKVVSGDIVLAEI